MSLETRLLALVQAIGADVKSLFSRVVPAGGTAGQVLVKTGPLETDFNWENQSGGGGSGMTFAQSRWQFNDFTANTSAQGLVPFSFTATSSGTIAIPTLAPGQYGAAGIRDSSTAGGGGTLEQSVPLFAEAGYAYRAIFRTAGVATATSRLGCSNSFSTALGNNFAFLEIVGTTGTFRARRNASGEGEVVDATTITLVANNDYVLDIDWTSATTIRFVLWELTTGTVLRSWTATTAAWPNPGASSIRFGARATESTTSALSDILVIDYMGFGPARPSSCPVPTA